MVSTFLFALTFCLPFALVFYLIFRAVRSYRLFMTTADIMERALERHRAVKKLEREQQSGFWINCREHGDVPITLDEYNKQCNAEKYYCPLCGTIPRKIWKKF